MHLFKRRLCTLPPFAGRGECGKMECGRCVWHVANRMSAGMRRMKESPRRLPWMSNAGAQTLRTVRPIDFRRKRRPDARQANDRLTVCQSRRSGDNEGRGHSARDVVNTSGQSTFAGNAGRSFSSQNIQMILSLNCDNVTRSEALSTPMQKKPPPPRKFPKVPGSSQKVGVLQKRLKSSVFIEIYVAGIPE